MRLLQALDRSRGLALTRYLQGTIFGLAPFLPPSQNIVDVDYFATLRIPIVAGRDFTVANGVGSQPVVIVSEQAARLYWPGEVAGNVIGKQLLMDRTGPGGPSTTTMTVIGIARDVKPLSSRGGSPIVYLPLQHYVPQLILVARTADDTRMANAIRGIITSANPDLPILMAQTVEA